MKIFFRDTNTKLTKFYFQLLEDIQKEELVSEHISESDMYTFFVRFLRNLITNTNSIILDSELSQVELIKLNLGSKKQSVPSFQTSLEGIEDLILRVKKSQSTISIYTSGTTGMPKKIDHTIGSLTKFVKNIDSNSIWGFAYNYTHIAGIQVFFQALFNQNTIVNIFGHSRLEVYDSIAKYEITHISATPTFYRLLLPSDNIFLFVKRVTFGGEKSDKSLHLKISKIFPNAKISNVYASTEIGTLLYSHDDFFEIPNSYRELIKISDNRLLVHETLIGKSDILNIVDHFYDTGDIVNVISENPLLFKFVSRISDYTNIGGYKVNLQEVQDVISSINGVKLVSVSARPNSVLGNVLIAEIVLQENQVDLNEETIRVILRSNLKEYKIPRIIKFVESLNYTKTGKLKKI